MENAYHDCLSWTLQGITPNEKTFFFKTLEVPSPLCRVLCVSKFF